MKNAKDTDLQRYSAVILLLWLENAAHFRSFLLGTEEALKQLLLRVSQQVTLQKQWGEREIKRSLRRNDERVEGQRHSDRRQLQQSRGPAHLRHSHTPKSDCHLRSKYMIAVL